MKDIRCDREYLKNRRKTATVSFSLHKYFFIDERERKLPISILIIKLLSFNLLRKISASVIISSYSLPSKKKKKINKFLTR